MAPNEAEPLYEELTDEGPSEDQTIPDGDTVRADRRDAAAQHKPDDMPTAEEEAAAPSEVDPKVAESYEEALERGANVKGEGRIG